MTSHLLLLVFFAALVSTAFALLMREKPRDQLGFGLFIFFCFLASAIVLGWVMYPLPS
jgi:hypothetical protein